MDRDDLQLRVVKVRRDYAGYEAESILYGPASKKSAEAKLQQLLDAYQDPDAYFIETWRYEND